MGSRGAVVVAGAEVTCVVVTAEKSKLDETGTSQA